MPTFFDNIKQFLTRLSTGQQAALGAVVVGGVGVLIAIAMWATQPDYRLLFGNLSTTDANNVVQTLKEDGVTYQLRAEGSAIYVPAEMVHELRLQYAGQGLVSDGQVGYELFDKGTLGMTDFMQKLNHKRALEGELSQTISTVTQVEMARVHLVIPERNPFRDQQNAASASVVLKILGGGSLKESQVRGIASLVSGAVEGMAMSDVTVLDTRGNLLSDPDSGDAPSLTSTQLEMKQTVEQHLTRNGQSMLDQVIGPGNSIVRVNADLDFTTTIQEQELIDPDSRTVLSEERLEENGADDNANSMVRNYEVSRTRVRSEESVGDVEYLTISVVLNQKTETREVDGEEISEPVPFTQEELNEVEALVKNAVGFRPDRGDQFTIAQSSFDTSVGDQVVEQIQQQERRRETERYVRYALMALALLLAFWLIRSASRRLSQATGEGDPQLDAAADATKAQIDGEAAGSEAAQLASGQPEEDEEMVLIDDIYTSKLSKEAKARLKAKHKMYEEIRDQAEENPEETAELLRSWLAEDAIPS